MYTVNHKKCPPSADTQQQRLKQRLVEAWSAMPQRAIDEAIDEWRTSNTSYDTYIGIVNLNGFVQPVRFYH